jgi:hypothetical protein
MKKQILLFMLALLPIVVWADASGTCGTNLTWTYEEATQTLTISGAGAMKDFLLGSSNTAPWKSYSSVIQRVVIGEEVTSIGKYAFSYFKSLTSITIPPSVKTIGNASFKYCLALSSITISEGVATIDNQAFYKCPNLTSLSIPSSVTSIGSQIVYGCSQLNTVSVDPLNAVYDSRDNCNAIIETKTNTLITKCNFYDIPSSVTCIGSWVFAESEDLTSITIPEGITTIGDHAFAYCINLSSISFPSSLATIGPSAFYSCSNLVSISIPERTTIDVLAFSNCYNLETISIPNSVNSIGWQAFEETKWLYNQAEDLIYIGNVFYKYNKKTTEYDHINIELNPGTVGIAGEAFYYCKGLRKIILPEGLEVIGGRAFGDCTGLNNIEIPEGVRKIDYTAFEFCENLRSITFPHSLEYIGSRSFHECNSLKTITLHENVSYIGNEAFLDCVHLYDLYINASQVPNTANNSFQNDPLEEFTLHVPASSLEAYSSIEPWSLFGTIVAINEPTLGQCATPTITYANGKVKFACETEDVEFVPSITVTPNQLQNGNELSIGGTFTVSVYAVKDGYDNSDTATMTINMSQMGDVNADGELNAADITAVVNAILGK